MSRAILTPRIENAAAGWDQARPSLPTSRGDRPSRAEDDDMGVQKWKRSRKSLKPLRLDAQLGLAEALNSVVAVTPQ